MNLASRCLATCSLVARLRVDALTLVARLRVFHPDAELRRVWHHRVVLHQDVLLHPGESGERVECGCVGGGLRVEVGWSVSSSVWRL